LTYPKKRASALCAGPLFCCVTSRYLTPWARKANKRSLQSWYIGLDFPTFQCIGDPNHFFNRIHPFMRGSALPVPKFIVLHFIEICIFTDGLLHAPTCTTSWPSDQTEMPALVKTQNHREARAPHTFSIPDDPADSRNGSDQKIIDSGGTFALGYKPS
jgi:hypothetical protein